MAEYNGKKLTMVDHDRDTPDGDAFARSHGFFGQPAMVIFDANGELAHRAYGPSTRAETEALVREWAERR